MIKILKAYNIPECMVKYLEDVEKMRKEYNDLRIEQIFSKRSKNNG
jgi:hypothetical protein